MQLNVYIPEDKRYLLDALTEEAQRTRRSRNELVLEAIERLVSPSQIPAYRTYPLGAGKIDRARLYQDRLSP